MVVPLLVEGGACIVFGPPSELLKDGPSSVDDSGSKHRHVGKCWVQSRRDLVENSLLGTFLSSVGDNIDNVSASASASARVSAATITIGFLFYNALRLLREPEAVRIYRVNHLESRLFVLRKLIIRERVKLTSS